MLKHSFPLLLVLGVFTACVMCDGSEPVSFEQSQSDCLQNPECRRAYFEKSVLGEDKDESADWTEQVKLSSTASDHVQDHKAKTAQLYAMQSALFSQTLAPGHSKKELYAEWQLKKAQAAFVEAQQAVRKAAKAKKPTKPVKVQKKKVSWFSEVVTDMTPHDPLKKSKKKQVAKKQAAKKKPLQQEDAQKNLDFLAKKNKQEIMKVFKKNNAHTKRQQWRDVARKVYQKELWRKSQIKKFDRPGPSFYSRCEAMRKDLETGTERSRVTIAESASNLDKIKNLHKRKQAKRSVKNLKKDGVAGVSVPSGWCARVFQIENYNGANQFVPGPRNMCLDHHKMVDGNGGDSFWNDRREGKKLVDSGVSSIEVWRCPPEHVQKKMERKDDEDCLALGVGCGRTAAVEQNINRIRVLNGKPTKKLPRSEDQAIDRIELEKDMESPEAMDGPAELKEEKKEETERDLALAMFS